MNPILFHIGRLAVPSYSVVILGAMLAAVALVPRCARRAGMKIDDAITVVVVSGAVGIVGARLLHVAIVLPHVLSDPAYAKTILGSGGVWYGGVIAGFTADVFLFRHFGVDVGVGFDTAAIPTLVCGGLGRIACFMSGCCFGSPTSVPWAVTYTNPIAHRLHADLPAVPVHPVQLYELAGVLVIAVVLDRIASRPHRAGSVFLLWIAAYGVLRAALETFRGDTVRGAILGVLSTSQAIGLVSAAVAIALLLRPLSPEPAVAEAPAPAPAAPRRRNRSRLRAQRRLS